MSELANATHCVPLGGHYFIQAVPARKLTALSAQTQPQQANPAAELHQGVVHAGLEQGRRYIYIVPTYDPLRGTTRLGKLLATSQGCEDFQDQKGIQQQPKTSKPVRCVKVYIFSYVLNHLLKTHPGITKLNKVSGAKSTVSGYGALTALLPQNPRHYHRPQTSAVGKKCQNVKNFIKVCPHINNSKKIPR